ncbi:hypothetical protein TCE0_015r03147 [Talaromyces pinophilus]|uniref:Uncharacterized protein n=1 Tax=Talaromyces pinophilus TaxID=128442 RepID=A0A6V8H282_TALPI|nr:hypothetical protein TCE0_015r03147 [Talaromyces pinophilus]
MANFYGGEWRKYIFASPFEKVDGLVSQRMMDPLNPCAWTSDATFSNMTTLEESGEVRMATRLTCDGSPIDPTLISCLDVAKLVVQWTLPGIMTTPEIIFKALKIRFLGRMKMNSKPPVRSGSVGRPIQKLEIDLEPFFRAYLLRCVEIYPDPIELTYLPCRSFTNDTIRMRSPSYHGKEATRVRYLTVEPADPSFYTRIISYVDIKTALAQETKKTGHLADPTAQRLIVSDIDLLNSILGATSFSSLPSELGAFSNWKSRQILTLTRPQSALTFMDEFVLWTFDPASRAVYISSCLQLSVARTLAFGSQNILVAVVFIASCLIRWLILEASSLAHENIFSFIDLVSSPGWVNLACTVFEYYLVLQCLTATQNWFMQ